MNAQQRKFLIDKIKEKSKIKIDELLKSIPPHPSMESYWLSECLAGKLKLKPEEEILGYLQSRAKAKVETGHSSSWYYHEDRWGGSREEYIRIPITSMLEPPAGFLAIMKAHKDAKDFANKEILTINQQLEMLETRITLASDKTLQKMIDEVDDMGNLSLIDTKVKFLE